MPVQQAAHVCSPDQLWMHTDSKKRNHRLAYISAWPSTKDWQRVLYAALSTYASAQQHAVTPPVIDSYPTAPPTAPATCTWMWTCLVVPVGLAGWIKKIIVLTSFCVLAYTRDISWISQLSHDIPVLWDVPGISLIVAVYTMDIPNTCSKCLNLTWN